MEEATYEQCVEDKKYLFNVVQKLRKNSLKTSLESILKVLVKENNSLGVKNEYVNAILIELCEEGQIVEKKISGLDNYRMPSEIKSNDTNTINHRETSLPDAFVTNSDFTSLVQDFQDFKQFATEKFSKVQDISSGLELALHENSKLVDVNQLAERTITSLTESITHLREELKHKNIIIQNLTVISTTDNNIAVTEKISSHEQREHKQTLLVQHASDVTENTPTSDEILRHPWTIVTAKSNNGRLLSTLADNEWLIESPNPFESLSADQNNPEQQENTNVHQNNDVLTNKGNRNRNGEGQKGGPPSEIKSTRPKSTRPIRTDHRLDNEVSRAKGRTTTILGDSMLKGQKSWELRQKLKQNIIIKSFSGASTNDLKDHCKPSLRRAPDHIILATGANDLRSEDRADEIALNIVGLAMDIKTEKNEVTISELFIRNDTLNYKAQEVNHFLNLFCSSVNIPIMSQSNIYSKHINGSKIHLNEEGDKILSRNLETCINY